VFCVTRTHSRTFTSDSIHVRRHCPFVGAKLFRIPATFSTSPGEFNRRIPRSGSTTNSARFRRSFGPCSRGLAPFFSRATRTHTYTRPLCVSWCACVSASFSVSMFASVRVCLAHWPGEEGARLTDDGSGTHTHTHRTDGSLATCLTPALDAAIAMASAWNPTDAATRRPTPKFGDHFPKIAGGHEPRKVVTSDRRVASCI